MDSTRGFSNGAEEYAPNVAPSGKGNFLQRLDGAP